MYFDQFPCYRDGDSIVAYQLVCEKNYIATGSVVLPVALLVICFWQHYCMTCHMTTLCIVAISLRGKGSWLLGAKLSREGG